MKKHLLRVLCIAFVLSLCLPMAACDMEFGGLVGELLAGNTPDNVVPDEWESDLVIEDYFPDVETAVDMDWNEVFTGDIATMPPTEDITYDYVTEAPKEEPLTSETPTTDSPPCYPVNIHVSFDELVAVTEDSSMPIFTPGYAASWNKIAEIDDYLVESIGGFGWVAFYTEQIGVFGYQIDNNEPVFSEAFIFDTEQPVIDAALAMGAKSASRFRIYVPVRDLSGKHFIKLLAKDAVGTINVITEFALQKAADPNAPVFNFWPADMMSSLVDQVGRYDIDTVQLGGNGEYITITTGTVGDPWVQLPMVNGQGYVASYIAIKYRTSSPITQGGVFVGSGAGPTGQGDEILYQMINDGKWHVLILDLSESPAVQNNVVNYLRWDMFTGGQNNVIDISYIAAFHSEQAALDYDASVADRYTD